MVWRSFGRVDVLPMCDGVGPFFETLGEAFPGVPPEVLRRATGFDPGAVGEDGGWRLRFRCFAIRLEDGRTFLVDAGIGPANAPAAAWAPVPGRLPDRLADGGIDPAAIEAVVITHLHTDHVGWAVVDGEAYFPNARYLLQRTEADAVDVLNPTLRGAVLDPLDAADRLHLVDGVTRLADGVTIVPTPGHTPGHQSVVVASGGEEVVVTGDVLVHAVQLVDPSVAYAYESDADAARQTRTRLLDDAAARGATLATAHLAEPFITAAI